MKARLIPLAGFCYLWLMIGFFTGTLVLLGPARWLTGAIQEQGWSQHAEDLAMIGLIIVYVAASALISLWVFRSMSRCQTRRIRMGIPASLTVAAAVCLWLWMDPARLAGAAGSTGGIVNTGSAQFVFGPYPEWKRIEELKSEGFTAIISLQHPAVLPFEPPGIKVETEAAKAIGMPFIHAPMMPWVSSNEASLQKIREIARTGGGRYYVHCGLGRDRVNIVKRMLELEGANIDVDKDFKAARTFAARYSENRPMQRGPIQPLETDVWLVPYPNEHELFGNMLAGQVRHVTILLDPAEPAQKGWVEELRRQFTAFSVPFAIHTVTAGATGRAEQVARLVRSGPRPAVVIAPFTAPEADAQIARTFMDAYRESRRSEQSGVRDPLPLSP